MKEVIEKLDTIEAASVAKIEEVKTAVESNVTEQIDMKTFWLAVIPFDGLVIPADWNN
jgi:predicted dinucleotide-utilizing enzyme